MGSYSILSSLLFSSLLFSSLLFDLICCFHFVFIATENRTNTLKYLAVGSQVMTFEIATCILKMNLCITTETLDFLIVYDVDDTIPKYKAYVNCSKFPHAYPFSNRSINIIMN